MPLSTGFVLASLFSCHASPAPSVTVQFQNKPPGINNTRSSSELAQLKNSGNSMSPNYGAEFPIVGGLTSSSFEIKDSIAFENTIHSLTHAACVRATAINISIIYTPTIYISHKYGLGSCRYILTTRHEMKHVNTDIITFKEFLPRIKQAIENAIADAPDTRPVDKSQMQKTQDNFEKIISAVLKDVINRMEQTRYLRQQQVDSREEYRYLSGACPQEPAN